MNAGRVSRSSRRQSQLGDGGGGARGRSALRAALGRLCAASRRRSRAVMSSPPALSRLAARVDPFIVMDVMSAAARIEAAGGSVTHMEVGQPSAPTPASIRAAAANALTDGRIGYTEALGVPSLRERIARHYRDAYGMNVPSSRVVVTTGSSGGFILPFGLSCLSQHPRRARARAGRHRGRRREPLCADA